MKKKKFLSLVTGESRLKETHLWKQLTLMVFKTLWFFSKSSLMIFLCWLRGGRSASWSWVLLSGTVTIVTCGNVQLQHKAPVQHPLSPPRRTGVSQESPWHSWHIQGDPWHRVIGPPTYGSQGMAHQEFELNDGFLALGKLDVFNVFN